MFQLSSECVMLLTTHSTKTIFMYAAAFIALVFTCFGGDDDLVLVVYFDDAG